MTVLWESGRKYDGVVSYRCRCDCGRITDVAGYLLRNGKVRSCGCLLVETTRRRNSVLFATHRMTGSPTYRCWQSIRARCRDARRKYYAAKGISVCERWRDSFEAFVSDMGERPSLKHTIDRIDGAGHYEPSNCRWATAKEQAANRTFNYQSPEWLAHLARIQPLGIAARSMKSAERRREK